MTRFDLPRLLLIGALALAAPRGAEAQERDPRWLPWMGCWQPVAEDPGDALLCVRPTEGGVEMTEMEGTEVRSTRAVRADGREDALEADGCTSIARASFSEDGRRIYTHARQSCDGGAAVEASGLIAMVSPTEWIDVQAQAEGESGLSWTRRYRRVSAERTRAAGFEDLAVDESAPARRARGAAASTADVDDVIEATRAVDAEAVRAWIAAMADPFDLDARRLVRLADAGVPSSVIDVMVAVSYPDRFALSRDGDVDRLGGEAPRAGRRSRGYPIPVYGGYYGYRGYYDPYFYDPYYGYYGSPSVIIVEPRPDPDPNAKVVKGRGYTRGSGSSGSSSGDSGRRDGGSKAPSAQAPSDSGSGSSSGSGSGSGSGSSGGEGRKAKPREN